MEQKEVELKVKVDDDMTVSLKIPIEIDASRLMGMLEKAKRMTKVGMKDEVRKIKDGTFHMKKFSPEEAKSFVREYMAAKGQEAKAKVAEKYNIPPDKAFSKYNYLHNTKGIR